jgi:hypothetical protein
MFVRVKTFRAPMKIQTTLASESRPAGFDCTDQTGLRGQQEMRRRSMQSLTSASLSTKSSNIRLP